MCRYFRLSDCASYCNDQPKTKHGYVTFICINRCLMCYSHHAVPVVQWRDLTNAGATTALPGACFPSCVEPFVWLLLLLQTVKPFVVGSERSPCRFDHLQSAFRRTDIQTGTPHVKLTMFQPHFCFWWKMNQ